MVTSQTGFGDPISWMFVVIGFPAIWFFSKKRIEDIETKSIQYDELVMVQAEFIGSPNPVWLVTITPCCTIDSVCSRECTPIIPPPTRKVAK